MEKYLEEMCRHLNSAYRNVESRLQAEGFKMRVLQVFRAWDEWAVYSRDYIHKLSNTFLGITAIVRLQQIFA